MLTKLFASRPTVTALSVRGNITPYSPELLHTCLKKVSPKTKCLAILVNSSGGSPALAHVMHSTIRLFKEKTGIRVLTFADEGACSAGYYVMTAGDMLYAESHSLVGGIGAALTRIDPAGLFHQHGVERTTVSSNGE